MDSPDPKTQRPTVWKAAASNSPDTKSTRLFLERLNELLLNSTRRYPGYQLWAHHVNSPSR